LTEDNEIGTFVELLSAARWWILGVALVAAVVAGAFGWPGARLHEASLDVRVQFPSNLTRAPLPDRFAMMAEDPTTVAEAVRIAGVENQVGAIDESLISIVSPDDARVVQLSVRLKDERGAERFIRALADVARAKAMATVKEQRAGLEESRQLNERLAKQIAKVSAEATKLGRSARGGAGAGDRLLAEVGVLQLNTSALQGQASLQNMIAQIDSEIEALDNAVVPDGDVRVTTLSPISRVIGYGVRGLVVGLVVALVCVYLPPVRRRLMTR